MWLALDQKQQLTGVFSRIAPAYRLRMEEAMRKGQAAGRDLVLDWVRPRPGMRVLDLACGPGTLTIPIARDLNGVGEVIGIDLADGMLEAARQAVSGRSLPIRFVKMDIEQLSFPSASFDAAACGHGLHFMPNLGRALREVRRVLKPKGHFGASIPPPDGPERCAPVDALRAALDRRLGPAPVNPELGATRSIVYDLDRFRAAALQAGFRFAETELIEIETTWDSAEHYAEQNLSWWSNAVRLDGLSEHVRRLVHTEVTSAVLDAAGDGPFGVPSRAHVLRAEA